jgi:hypothetical protein
VWAACNPAYPARISLDYMEREFLALGPEQFARERLGKSNWPQDSTGRFGVISREAWEACQDADESATAAGKVSFGIAVSRDGRSAAIAACGTSGFVQAVAVVPAAVNGVGNPGEFPGKGAGDLDVHAGGLVLARAQLRVRGPRPAREQRPVDEVLAPSVQVLSGGDVRREHLGDQQGDRRYRAADR